MFFLCLFQLRFYKFFGAAPFLASLYRTQVIEGFGGGNNFTQYLAAFSPEKADNGKLRLTLLDVIPIGGKGGRTINQLKPSITFNKATTHIALPALEVTEKDAPNFPSKKMMIQFTLKDGRLFEIAKHRKTPQK